MIKTRHRAFSKLVATHTVSSGRALVPAMLVLLVCDAIGGLLAVLTGVDKWAGAWGFDAKTTVPLPVGAGQLVLAWTAAHNRRRSLALTAALLLSAFCLISVIFGAFDGDLIHNARSTGLFSWRVGWGVVLLAVTAAVGLLATIRTKQLHRLR